MDRSGLRGWSELGQEFSELGPCDCPWESTGACGVEVAQGEEHEERLMWRAQIIVLVPAQVKQSLQYAVVVGIPGHEAHAGTPVLM